VEIDDGDADIDDEDVEIDDDDVEISDGEIDDVFFFFVCCGDGGSVVLLFLNGPCLNDSLTLANSTFLKVSDVERGGVILNCSIFLSFGLLNLPSKVRVVSWTVA
jgi:hypothetical protein